MVLGREFLAPSASSKAPAPMVVLMSTRPKSPALQQFFEAQINLLSSPFSIKKGEGDWFTLVKLKLRDKHKWYSALTGVALQAATETLNKVITMLCGSGTNQWLISHLGKNCHHCHRVKTGEFKEPPARATIKDRNGECLAS